MASAITVQANGANSVPTSLWTDDEKALIKTQIAPGASDNELRLFQAQCQRTGLDPFSRQIYAIMREQWDPTTRQKVKKMTIQTSIDGFRVIAQRSGKYAGQDGPYWCGEDGEWKDVWLSDELPAAAKVLVYHRDFDRPISGIALFREYASRKTDGTLMGLWKKTEKPSVMIAKCAEALAFRKAFPNDLSGLYTAEEMSQADVKVLDAEQSPAPAPAPAPVVAAAPTSGRRRTASAQPAPAAPVAAPEPAPEPVDAVVVEPSPEPPAQPVQPAPVETTSSPSDLLRQRVELLSPLGLRALFKAYGSVPGFSGIDSVEAFLTACAPQPGTHLSGLTDTAVAKLNDGLHPKTGQVLVKSDSVPNDPDQPFG